MCSFTGANNWKENETKHKIWLFPKHKKREVNLYFPLKSNSSVSENEINWNVILKKTKTRRTYAFKYNTQTFDCIVFPLLLLKTSDTWKI